jgi:hypothetical protein
LAAIISSLLLMATAKGVGSWSRGHLCLLLGGCLLAVGGQYRLYREQYEIASKAYSLIRLERMLQEPLETLRIRTSGPDPLGNRLEKTALRLYFQTPGGIEFGCEVPGSRLQRLHSAVSGLGEYQVAWQAVTEAATTRHSIEGGVVANSDEVEKSRAAANRIVRLQDWQRLQGMEVHVVVYDTDGVPMPDSVEIVANETETIRLFNGAKETEFSSSDGSGWTRAGYKDRSSRRHLLGSWQETSAASPNRVGFAVSSVLVTGVFLLALGAWRLRSGKDPGDGAPGWRRDSIKIPPGRLTVAAPAPTPLMQGAAIDRPTAGFLLAAFVIVVAFPAVYEFAVAPAAQLSLFREFCSHFPTSESCKAFEESLASKSRLAQSARRWYQPLVTQMLHQGSRKVVVGNNGFMFMPDTLALTTGEGFLAAGDSAVTGLVDLDQQLRRHGIHLVVLPVPAKEAIVAERLWAGYPSEAGPALNPDYHVWKQRLAEAGVDVVELHDLYWSARGKTDLYLKYDPHWAPRAVDIAADQVAKRVGELLGTYDRQVFTAKGVNIEREPDFYCLNALNMPNGSEQFPLEHAYKLTQVFQDGQPVADLSGDEAPILLFGDSFAGMYDDSSAGLAAALMLRLGTRIQHLKFHDDSDGENMTGSSRRRLLLPATWAQKKIMIYQFVTWAMYDKGWKPWWGYAWGNLEEDVLPTVYQPGTRLDFTQGSCQAHLRGDWYDPEGGWGRWSGREAAIDFRLEKPQALELRMMATTFGAQRIAVTLNGREFKTIRMRGGDMEIVRFDLPADAICASNSLRLTLPDAKSPQSVGKSEDSRILGVRIAWIELCPAGQGQGP